MSTSRDKEPGDEVLVTPRSRVQIATMVAAVAIAVQTTWFLSCLRNELHTIKVQVTRTATVADIQTWALHLQVKNKSLDVPAFPASGSYSKDNDSPNEPSNAYTP